MHRETCLILNWMEMQIATEAPDLSPILQSWYQEQGLSTQTEAAPRLDITQGMFSRLLKPGANATLETVAKVAARMGGDWRRMFPAKYLPAEWLAELAALEAEASTQATAVTVIEAGSLHDGWRVRVEAAPKASRCFNPEALAIAGALNKALWALGSGPGLVYRVAAPRGLGPWPAGSQLIARGLPDDFSPASLPDSCLAIMDVGAPSGPLLRRLRRRGAPSNAGPIPPEEALFIAEAPADAPDHKPDFAIFQANELRIVAVVAGAIVPVF